MAVIEINALRKEFSVPDGTEVAVDGVDYAIEEGEFFTIVGPSGCGKTTTLRCLAGLETPTSGTVRLDSREVTDVPANKRNVAMMFQSIALYPHMTVRENIEYPLKVDHVPKEERRKEAEEVADIMQISDLLDKYPGELSGGQRQRAALGRTIIQDPIAFLMDEPLSDLDAKLKVEMRKEIQRVQKRLDKPTVYVTHDQEEALTMSDRIAVMNNGKAEQVGTPDELYDKPRNIFVADFIGNPSMNFISATVGSVSDGTAIVKGDEGLLSFEVNGLQDTVANSNVTVGFRPENGHLFTDRTGQYESEVMILERIDDRTLVYLDGPGDEEIRVTIPSDMSVSVDDTLSLTVDSEDIFLFDDNGELIERRPEQTVAEEL